MIQRLWKRFVWKITFSFKRKPPIATELDYRKDNEVARNYSNYLCEKYLIKGDPEWTLIKKENDQNKKEK